jgi:hypothetical protein
MILGPFASGRHAATTHSTRPIPCGLGEEKGHKWRQKGDFYAAKSFATASKVVSEAIEGF